MLYISLLRTCKERIMKFKLLSKKYFFTVVFLVSVFYVIYFLASIMMNLRPVADDYCLAGVADLTPSSYFHYWYTSFIADASTLFANYFLIALPAVYLPFGIGTSVAFVFCVLAIAVVTYLFLNSRHSTWVSKLGMFGFIFVYTFMAWVTYWLVLGRGNSGNMISRGTSGDMVFFGSIMNWQAANVNYVLLPFVVFLIYTKLFTPEFSNINIFWAFVAGLVVGGSFYVLSSVFILLIFVQLVAHFFQNQNAKIRQFRNESIVVAAAIISISISYFSPGARKRSMNYTQEVSLMDIANTSIDAIFTWLTTIYLPAIFITLLMGLVFHYILTKFLRSNVYLNPQKFIVLPLILSFVTFVVTKVSELFAYKGWWHELSSRTFLFIGTFFLGIYLMNIWSKYLTQSLTILSITIACTTIFVGLISIKQASDSIENRQVRWEAGAAQVSPDMDPFDRETAWVNACWVQLEEKRRL